ncbi:[Pyruvate dehydrogenase [acetyl-transferring]]-phosphatase 1, mitochondrial, partial [Bonamia ostreae]
FPLLCYHKSNSIDTPLVGKESFLFADDCFLTNAISRNDTDAAKAGACAVVAHVKDDKLRVANAGDCRLVLAEKNEEGVLEAIEMSHVDQIGESEIERERLLSNHPREKGLLKRNRIHGRMEPTRGFGDGEYKRSVFNDDPDNWKPPYSTAEPHISERQLSERSEFAILASDGIFDELSAEQAVQCVSTFLERRESGEESLRNASAALVETAFSRAAERNNGRLENGENIDKMLKISGKERRYLHDDMTALIIFFEKEYNVKSKFSGNGQNNTEAPKIVQSLVGLLEK